ncbi:MAG: hypothetical protein NTW52_00925 [Planctomycetota bacterium]|nr:hypothetical protein [Planctomycetota bacterium]
MNTYSSTSTRPTGGRNGDDPVAKSFGHAPKSQRLLHRLHGSYADRGSLHCHAVCRLLTPRWYMPWMDELL